MTRHADWEEDTVPLAGPVHRPLQDTLELPPVAEPPTQAAPPVPTEQPVQSEPAVATERAPGPTPPAAAPRVATPPPAAPPATPPATAPPVAAPPVAGSGGRRSRTWLVGLLALALVLGGVAVGLGRLRSDTSVLTRAIGRALSVQSVRSVDPSGGSGLRREGSSAGPVWRTQRYRSAEFGSLKPGVGLLLDLGRSTRVSAVRLTSDVPGTTLELHAADAAGRLGARVARIGSAAGAVTLHAKGAPRGRYWLVWVPRLGSDGRGFWAQLGSISVRG